MTGMSPHRVRTYSGCLRSFPFASFGAPKRHKDVSNPSLSPNGFRGTYCARSSKLKNKEEKYAVRECGCCLHSPRRFFFFSTLETGARPVLKSDKRVHVKNVSAKAILINYDPYILLCCLHTKNVYWCPHSGTGRS